MHDAKWFFLNCFIQPESLDVARTGSLVGVLIVADYIGLLIASIVGLAAIIERLVRTRRRRIYGETLLHELEQSFRHKDLNAAVAACRGSPTVLGSVMAVELEEHRQGNISLEEVLEVTGEELDTKMNANLDILATVAKVGPLLGLLGTVLGMLYAFGQIDAAMKKETLAYAITAALDSTVRGLIIAITSLTFEGYFLRRIDHHIREVNTAFTKIMRAVRRNQNGEADAPAAGLAASATTAAPVSSPASS